jgi:hypothetical protein
VKADAFKTKAPGLFFEQGHRLPRVAAPLELRIDLNVVDEGRWPGRLQDVYPQDANRLVVAGSRDGPQAVVGRSQALGQQLVMVVAAALDRLLLRPPAAGNVFASIARDGPRQPRLELLFGHRHQLHRVQIGHR